MSIWEETSNTTSRRPRRRYEKLHQRKNERRRDPRRIDRRRRIYRSHLVGDLSLCVYHYQNYNIIQCTVRSFVVKLRDSGLTTTMYYYYYCIEVHIIIVYCRRVNRNIYIYSDRRCSFVPYRRPAAKGSSVHGLMQLCVGGLLSNRRTISLL